MNINILKMNKDEQDYVVDRLVEYNLSKVPAKQNELFIDLSKKYCIAQYAYYQNLNST